MSTENQQKIEQQEIIREAIENTETETGLVTFPDHNCLRIQVFVADHMKPDLGNAINRTLPADEHFHVCEIMMWGDDGFVVEFER